MFDVREKLMVVDGEPSVRTTNPLHTLPGTSSLRRQEKMKIGEGSCSGAQQLRGRKPERSREEGESGVPVLYR